jgi:hypothetical protein
MWLLHPPLDYYSAGFGLLGVEDKAEAAIQRRTAEYQRLQNLDFLGRNHNRLTVTLAL